MFSGGNLRRDSPAGHTKHPSFDTDLLYLVFFCFVFCFLFFPPRNKLLAKTAVSQSGQQGRREERNVFSPAIGLIWLEKKKKKLPLWSTEELLW